MSEQLKDSREIAASMRTMFNEEGDSTVRVLDPVLRMLVAYRTAAQEGLPVHRVDPKRSTGRKAPSCSDQMKAVASSLFPEWADAINAVGINSAKDKEVHRRGLH